MKLYQSPTSPYVRMVRAAAELKGLSDRIELADARADQAAYEKLNPLNKVPCMVTDDGEALIESRLICEYVDSLDDKLPLYPRDSAGRRDVLQREAIIHGVMDATVLRRMDSRKPDTTPSQWWDDRQKRKVDLGLSLIESELKDYTNPKTILPILTCCMCHFLERVSADDWRKGYPALSKWYDAYKAEPHMAATEVNG
ncbi:MAG: glutathione S-transferase [Alphaproteobacteria bacterium]|jgi:glutathione S-transferase